MRKIFQTSIALITLSIFTLLLIGSCEKMSDTYQQFLGEGETIYIGKADSVQVGGGNYRAEVSFLLMSDPKVDNYKLFWNNRQDSIVNPVTRTDGIDTIRVMVNDLLEGTHHFEIVTFDKYGNSSVPSLASGRVYGELYQASLLNSNRIVGSMDRNRQELILNWMEAAETLEAVELQYINNQGETKVHLIPSIVDTYVLPDFPADGTFKHRALFVPHELAIDTFYTSFQETIVDEQMMGGRIMSLTTEARSGTPPNQLSIWVSTDFDGTYEVENVEAATWVEITDSYPLPSATNTVTPWGPIDLWDLMGDDDTQIYVAFKYIFNPDNPLENGGINWRIQNFDVRSKAGAQILNQQQASITLVHKGPWENGRYTVSPTLLLLRRNAADVVTPTTTWGITRAIQ